MKKTGIFLTALVLGSTLVAGAVSRARAEDFYKDKAIVFIVAYSPGGSFDTYSRLIARHLSKHVPGNPTTIVQNMTGAGGIIAANYLYNKAKPGLAIGAWGSALVLQDVMGNKAAKFDGRKFGWLGVPSFYDTVCTLRSDAGIKTMEEWFASKRPIKIGAIGPGTSTSDVPKLVKAAIGLPIRMVEGYRGGAKVRLALESGEVHGYCGSWQTIKSISMSSLKSGRIRMLFQASNKSHPEIKHVPLAVNYAKTDKGRKLLDIADSVYRTQFPYTMSPGTPKKLLRIMQKAFIDTLNDPELLAEAKQSKLEIEPMDGPTKGRAMRGLYDLDSSFKKQLRAILVPGK